MINQNRRQFFTQTTAAATGLLLANQSFNTLQASDQVQSAPKIRLKKALKIGMIEGATIDDKFALLKSTGFDGVEMDSPMNVDREAAKAAAAKHGITIHGVVISTHWNIRHSSPNADERAKALEHLKNAIRDAADYGAKTVLLVPGVVGKDGTYDEIWPRAIEQVKLAIPDAEKAKVQICIETVWNQFITKPEQMIKFVDECNSPFVGAYFDCSNMLKYGVSSADWIKALGKRLYKIDFKGYSLKIAKDANNDGAGFKAPIGEGDENWPEIIKALTEVSYAGEWATAEVSGGGEARLKDISERMDRIFELK